MLAEIRGLRKELNLRCCPAGNGTWDEQVAAMDNQLADLEKMMSALEAQEKQHHTDNVESHSSIQAEIDNLRAAVQRMQDQSSSHASCTGTDAECADNSTAEVTKGGVEGGATSSQAVTGARRKSTAVEESAGAKSGDEEASEDGAGKKRERQEDEEEGEKKGADDEGSEEKRADKKKRAEVEERAEGERVEERAEEEPAAAEEPAAEELAEEEPKPKKRAGPAGPAQANQVDVDMAMPYGDLEPFGREDTAQELTEDSIRQSDMMVDQLERAEVSEEKRAVFRALTRLRGAAITSYDGIARSQTGNIDGYARTNQWRTAHPVHHLASDEADVKKWAFPDGADE